MILYSEALQKIINEIAKLNIKTEEIDLLDSLNRFLAEDVKTDVDLPPFDNSAMDGYAIKFSDRNNWKVIGEVSAGNFMELLLGEEDAVLITTGSKIPSNADTVIPVEYVNVHGNNIKLIEGLFVKKGMNIRPGGSDLSKGKIALKKYTQIDAKAVAVLASCGKEKVRVFQKIKCAVLATGDELIPVSEKPVGDKIRASNSYALYSAVNEIAQKPLHLGFLKDNKELIQDKIRSALNSDIDILITTGGVSVGKYDFLREIFDSENVKEIFWRVNIKPGKPIYFGVYEKGETRKLVFGLPGNPVSSLVNFHVFIKPAICHLFNQRSAETVTAILMNDLKKKDDKRHFSRGYLYKENNEWQVTAEFSQSSGNLVEMVKANCLIDIPEEKRNRLKGEKVECIMI